MDSHPLRATRYCHPNPHRSAGDARAERAGKSERWPYMNRSTFHLPPIFTSVSWIGVPVWAVRVAVAVLPCTVDFVKVAGGNPRPIDPSPATQLGVPPAPPAERASRGVSSEHAVEPSPAVK